VIVMIWVRWTLPRLRIDQVITTCLKYCVPIAAIAFLGATLWQFALPNRVFFGIKEAPVRTYTLTELLQPEPKTETPTEVETSNTAARETADDRAI
jgi:hypothetical protein